MTLKYLPDSSLMKAADNETIHKMGMHSLVLMERAALQSLAVMEHQKVDFSNVLLVCGSGNNGGDGFAIARLMHLKGFPVTVVFVGNENSRTEETTIQMQILQNYGVKIQREVINDNYSTIVDCIFGIGLSRKIEGTYFEIIDWMNKLNGTKIAIDIPSGISADNGYVLGIAFHADFTIAMAFKKIGMMLYPGSYYTGEIITVDIGIDTHIFDKELDICVTYSKKEAQKQLPNRMADSHKGTYGKLLIIAGSQGMAGAAYLCAKAAYTVGAGLVQIYTHSDNRIIIQELVPEGIMTSYHSFELHVLERLLEWADAVIIGPGIGENEIAVPLLCETIKRIQRPCVIDADGLNILSKHMELLTHNQKEIILTPHMKEMTRLIKCDLLSLQNNKIQYLKEFTDKYNAICVLKDTRTLVAKSSERIYLNISGNSAMAKAGSGDVLTGIIGGLLVQGIPYYNAATLGVYLHGLAGDEAKKVKGSYSVLASDIIENIYKVLKEFEEVKDSENVF